MSPARLRSRRSSSTVGWKRSSGPVVQLHRHEVERRQDVAVGGIARRRQCDALARLEGGKKRQDEGRRGAGGDDDARGIDADAVCVEIMAGDRRAQRRKPERLGIAQRVLVERAPRRREHGAGRRRRRLADLEVQHVGAGCGALVRGAQHVHDDEGRNRGAPRELQRHRRTRARDRKRG